MNKLRRIKLTIAANLKPKCRIQNPGWAESCKNLGNFPALLLLTCNWVEPPSEEGASWTIELGPVEVLSSCMLMLSS